MTFQELANTDVQGNDSSARHRENREVVRALLEVQTEFVIAQTSEPP